MGRLFWSAVFMSVAIMQPVSAQTPESSSTDESATRGYSPAQEFEIVDCVLPGQVRAIGGRSYLTPRRPIRTTAARCALRGGEYKVYDRSSFQASLDIWLPLANDGDPEAAVFVGEIYERGVTGTPDYAEAARWYQVAADEDFARAQFKLGTLYEQGLGVERDVVKALNLYRQSQGIDEGDLVSQRMLQAKLTEERETLGVEIDKLQAEIGARDSEIATLQNQIDTVDLAAEDARRQIATLGARLVALESDQVSSRGRLQARQTSLSTLPPATEPVIWPDSGSTPSRRKFGRYYALVIGVQNYAYLDNLRTPLNDVARLADTLESRYGFTVVSLEDPSDLLILKTINDLFEDLGEKDNLLIYFAGRGNRTEAGNREIGYWLPANADRPPDDTYWVDNIKITNHLARIRARSVLVVSDAAYVGLISDDPNMLIGDGYDHPLYIKRKLPRRARLLLSSGADSALEGDGDSSMFASALLDVLRANDGVLAAPSLYIQMGQRLRSLGVSASNTAPALKAIGAAGHELGDFFFVPRN